MLCLLLSVLPFRLCSGHVLYSEYTVLLRSGCQCGFISANVFPCVRWPSPRARQPCDSEEQRECDGRASCTWERGQGSWAHAAPPGKGPASRCGLPAAGARCLPEGSQQGPSASLSCPTGCRAAGGSRLAASSTGTLLPPGTTRAGRCTNHLLVTPRVLERGR